MVIAVVVTFGRTDSLRRTIDAIRNQERPPDRILTIDNGSRARSVLADLPDVEIIETGENLGPSGGFEVGLKAALARGATKIWLLDDDSEPESDCLAIMLEKSRGKDLVIPRQVKPGGWEGYPKSWHGTLIDSEIVRDIGFPNRDLFFSKEDREYFWRAGQRGYLRTRVPEAVVVHNHPSRRPHGRRRSWKLYYEIRNHLHFHLRMRPLSFRRVMRAAKVGLGMPIAILLHDERKTEGLRLWWWGVRDFLKGRLGKTLDPADWKA